METVFAETKPDKTKASDQKKKPGPIYKPAVAMLRLNGKISNLIYILIFG